MERRYPLWFRFLPALVRALAVVGTPVLTIACGGSTTTTVLGPSTVKCQTELAPTTTAFPAGGGTSTVAVVAARECVWTATSDASWIRIGTSSGQGPAAIDISISANGEPRARAGALLVNDQRVELSQEGAPCRFELTGPAGPIDPSGGDVVLTLTTLRGCTWSATTNAAWIRLVPPLSGSSDASIRLSVTPNAGAGRSGVVTVGDATWTVTQEAAEPAPPPPPPPAPEPPPPPRGPDPPSPPTCSYTVQPGSIDAPAAGAEQSIRVSTDSRCDWEASSDSSWVTVLNTSGSGNGTVRFRTAANTGSARTGTIRIAQTSVTIAQVAASPPPPAPAPPTPAPTPPAPTPPPAPSPPAPSPPPAPKPTPPPTPAPPPACAFELSRTSDSFGADGGQGSVRVKTTSQCAWTASSGAAWITIVSGTSSTGSGEVRYAVAQNSTGDTRTGSLTVAGVTVTVRQEGTKPRQVDVDGAVTGLSGGCPSLSFSVGGTAVLTDGSTDFKRGSCSEIKNGTAVGVKGFATSATGPIRATQVEVKSDKNAFSAPEGS